MKGWLMGAALVLVVVVAGAGGDTGGEPAVDTPGAVVEVDADGLPPRIEYSGDLAYDCHGPHAANVQPDTPEAVTAAERRCLRLGMSLGRSDWPDGVAPR